MQSTIRLSNISYQNQYRNGKLTCTDLYCLVLLNNNNSMNNTNQYKVVWFNTDPWLDLFVLASTQWSTKTMIKTFGCLETWIDTLLYLLNTI